MVDVEPGPSTSKYITEFESTLVLYKSILNSPFYHLAIKLEKEINSSGIIPKRIDVVGNEQQQTLKEYLQNRSLASVPSVQEISRERFYKSVNNDVEPLRISRYPPNAYLPSKKTFSHAKLLNARSIGSVIPAKRFHDLNMIEHSLNYQYRITGHIDKTYNVRFDKTGRYIVTASDDALMKVWDLNSALLRYSFRGHPSLISDMDISFCNQFIASVGHDKVIRIWSFQTGAQVEVCRHHTNNIAGISFLPMVYGTKRWLVSFGNDCNVIFYEFDEQRKVFNDRALIFNVRTAPGLKVLSGTHSPCGNWVAAGDSHGYVHLFRFQENNYIVDLDFKAIPVQEKLDTLEWSNTGLSFVASSSRYPAGRIWRYINNMWRYLEFAPKLPDASIMSIFHSAKLKYGICMAIWSLDDSKIIVSGTDFKIRIFDSYTAAQLFCLDGHKAEAFHLKCHPIHANVVVSSAHDGFVIVWDIEKGKVLKKFINEASDDDGDVISSAILDCSFSPDGTVLAVVDDLGRLTVYGYGGSDGYKTPKEQFFSSDYELIEIDDHEFPMDSITGLAPHLNNPPWLVDIQRLPYEEKWQKRVPGRETDNNNIVCPWLTRNVAPKLDEGMLNVWTETQKFFSLESLMHLDNSDSRLELYKIPGTEEPVTVKPPTVTRRRAPIPTVEQVLQEQQQRYMQDNLMGYRSEDDEDYQNDSTPERDIDGNATSCESDTSDESYEGEGRNLGESQEEQRAVTTASGRRVRSRNLNLDVSVARPRRSKRTNADTQDDSVEGDEDTRDGPPTEEEPSTSTEQKKISKEKKKKGVNPELNSFPDSMQIVKPTRFPYVAQLGDRVVYFKQGHLAYLHRVEKLKLYPVSSKMRPQLELKAEEFCIVDEVKYTRKPYRLTCLRLAQLTRHNERSGYTFTVKYHDLQDSPDFIILRQQYDLATTNALQEGNEMEAILDGLWWTGTITKKQGFSEEFPNSHWNCLAVRWDNGDDDLMSPWDCQPKTPGRKSGSPATAEDEVQLGKYIPIEDDWSGNGRPQANMENNCERLYIAVNNLSCVETVAAFAYPVNLSDFPTYAHSVDYCIDLQTIAERLKNHFYRSMKAVQHDIRHIAVAAEQFNEPNSIIVRNSRRLVEALIRFSKDIYLDPADIVKYYDSMFDLPDEDIIEYRQRDIRRELEPDIVQMASSSQTVVGEAGWIKDARSKLQTAFNQACAKPFFDKEEAGNHAICVALAETGDLKSVLNELHLFSHPSGVIKKIGTILDGCREAIDDPRSRLHHSIDQVMKLVEQKMKPVVDEVDRNFTKVSEAIGMNVRSLRKRAKRSSAYQTRSHRMSSPGSRRTVHEEGFYSQLDSGKLSIQDEDETNRSTRASRRQRVNLSEEMSRETTVEREPIRVSQRRSTRGSRESQQGPSKEMDDSDESDCMEAQSSSSGPTRRKQQRFKEELEEELRELQEDAEERLETRRAIRNKKRKRCSTESDEDCFSNDSARSSQRPTRRSTRLRHDDSEDEEKINEDAEERLETRRAIRNKKRKRCSTESDEDCFSNDSARSSQRPTRRSTRLRHDDSEDEEKINVSQYGRLRRSRRLD